MVERLWVFAQIFDDHAHELLSGAITWEAKGERLSVGDGERVAFDQAVEIPAAPTVVHQVFACIADIALVHMAQCRGTSA
jgi:hypothetical protein